MFSFLRSRTFVILIGLLLIAIFIWYAGPYFGFGIYHPLETENARLLAILLVVVCWLVSVVVKWLRARVATRQLLGAVLSQPQPDRSSGESAKLRERFEEAVAALQKQQPRGRTLYDLPWYVFIGAPGSGKTTALLNSGLKFPLEQRVGKGAVRGVGGTRNCDWWFTEGAVFLDTAGRYTTQDSDQTSDSEGWREFLALLAKYRKRRPLNGVVLTISAQDLLTQGDAARETHVESARRRLTELTQELHVQLPVYLMVTKCDMVAGFTEYFEDLSQEGRAQVWGSTFPYEQTLSGEAARVFPVEFDALIARLNARLFARLEEERGARRRGTVFAFPQQMAALRDLISEFVTDVFSTGFDGQVLLRGVYFTSGTQDGTQIDRLLGAIGRRFGVAPEAVAPAPGRGKAYFVERLLKDVVIGESGLAGVNRRLEMRKAAWQFGAYGAMTLAVVLGLIALSVSYARNRDYLSEVGAALQGVTTPATGVSLEASLPHINAVRVVVDAADKYREDTPLNMRWGLYQGGSVGRAARDVYLRELDTAVLPQFAARVRQHLIDYAPEPEKLYVYLKAYLMLGEPRRLDKEHLQLLADLEWGAPETGTETSLAMHFKSLLDYSDTLRPIPVDPALVAQARTVVRQASIPKIMYGQLKRSYGSDSPDALRLDLLAGVGIEKVFRLRSGRRLAEPVPSLYTRKVFNELTRGGMAPLIKQFADERDWVWGTGGGSALASVPQLISELTDYYEKDYIAAWEAILSDLEIVPFSTVQQYTDALGLLVAPTSPLRGILQRAAENTTLASVSAEPAPPASGIAGVGARMRQGAKDIIGTMQKGVTGTSVTPGTAVTQHFREIHRIMAGAPAPIDGFLDQIRKVRDQLLKLGPQVGGADPLKALSGDSALRDLRSTLQQDAVNLPASVKALVEQVAYNAGGSVRSDATRELEKRFQEEIVARCRLLVEGTYPFGGTRDMPIGVFGEVFGYGGLYDKFFTDTLEPLVDRLQRPWAWRPDSVSPTPGLLSQFERAERIRQMFFSPGAKTPEVGFTLRLSNLDARATRFYINIDGQERAVVRGAESRSAAVWPGPQKLEKSFAYFEDGVAQPEQAVGFDGPWAWFRVVDYARRRANAGQPGTDLVTELQFETNYHRAQVTLEAANPMSNPFAAGDWRQFRCEP